MTITTWAWIVFAFIAFAGITWLAYEFYNAPLAPDETDKKGADEGKWPI